jgi:hypothetical protein
MEEKARSLRERGRRDVIEKMSKHSIASHQRGNIHPFVPEVLQDKEWDEGVEAMRRFEDSVSQELLKTFGCEPVGLSRHNCYYGPQHVAVAGERGIPYMYNVVGITGHAGPTWYAGALTVGMDMSEDLDIIFSRDEVFEDTLRRMDQWLRDRVEQGSEYATIFSGHPVRVMTRGWPEFHMFSGGKTRTSQELGWLYGIKSKAEEERAKVNFRRFIEYLRDHSDVEVVGIEDFGQLFSTQLPTIRRDVLTLYAGEFERAGKPILHSTFSPAELVCAFAESLIYAEEHGDLPSEVQRRDVLGPKSRPAIGIECDGITHERMITFCRQLVEHVSEQGALPANFHIGDARVGIGQFAHVAARAFKAEADYEKYEKLRIHETPRYPDAAFQVDEWIRWAIGEHYAMPLDFSCDRLAEYARLQTWTMKPAWLHPPQGHALLSTWHEGERMTV